jgi:hypothetical protein
MYRTACSANRCINTAPIAKFAAKKTPTSRWSAHAASGSKPVVPVTTCTPCATHQEMFAGATSDLVNSTATSAPASVSASSEPVRVTPSTTCPAWDGSTATTSSSPASAATARQTSRPIRPAAPTTPTRITP